MSVVTCPSPSRADLRRENIKGVARRLFIENGFHATGIALIAKDSGVAVQQLYRDFPAKEDIIAAIVEEDCERYADLATLDAALIDQDRHGIREWLTSAPCGKDQDADQLFLEIFAEASRNPRINSIVSNVRRTMFENVSRAFAGLDGSLVVGEQHFLLAEALMIVSSGSICARSLNGKSVDLVCDMLVEQLLKNGMPVDQTP